MVMLSPSCVVTFPKRSEAVIRRLYTPGESILLMLSFPFQTTSAPPDGNCFLMRLKGISKLSPSVISI